MPILSPSTSRFGRAPQTSSIPSSFQIPGSPNASTWKNPFYFAQPKSPLLSKFEPSEPAFSSSIISKDLEIQQLRPSEKLFPEERIVLPSPSKFTIPEYPASYAGVITPESNFGCRLIARRLNDLYQTSTSRCSRRKLVNHDYFGIIAREQAKGNCLVEVGPNWILPLFIDYFEGGRREYLRMARLRRKDAEYQLINGEYRDFHSEVLPVEINLDNLTGNLSIYNFIDADFSDPEVWLLFAPVSSAEAQRILAWTELNKEYYLQKSYLAVSHLPAAGKFDLEYLFPITTRTFGNITILESETCSSQELRDIFNKFEVDKAYPRLNWKIGTYAAFLLAESTFYRFPIRWENSKIIIGECGYVQAYDLFGTFERICADIVASGTEFQEVDSWNLAATVCQETDLKAFYGQGKYWLAVPKDRQVNLNVPISPNYLNFGDLEFIQLDFPLRALRKLPESTKFYLESLGYSVDFSKDSKNYFLELGTRTIVQGEKTLTEYYYLSSAGKEIRVYVGEGYDSPLLKELLEKYLATGQAFPVRIQNLMDSYPDFIPSFQPIPLNLSPYPEKARIQLEKLF